MPTDGYPWTLKLSFSWRNSAQLTYNAASEDGLLPPVVRSIAPGESLMPATLILTEDAVHRLAPDTDAVQAARGLLRKKSFLKPGISADATWLLGQCQGSGKTPYEVSIDLADPSSPTFR